MVRVITLSDAHEHLHYSSRRFRDCLLAEILAASRHHTKVNCGKNDWQSGAREELFSLNGTRTSKISSVIAKTEHSKVSLKKNYTTKNSENHVTEYHQNSETNYSTESNEADDDHTMNPKHKSTNDDASTNSHIPYKKLKQDAISDYETEKYISETEINEIIKKYESYSVQKQTCSVFDLNTISTVSHNIVINPESGEVESIIRKEYDKSTVPQCFFIPQQNNSLDIIEEETDDVISQPSDIDERSSVRRCSISTQTDLSESGSVNPLKKSQTIISNLNAHSKNELIVPTNEFKFKIESPGSTKAEVIQCDRCGNHIQPTRGSSTSPVNVYRHSYNDSQNTSNRNSTYSMSSGSMSLGLQYDSTYSSLNRNSSSISTLSNSSIYSTPSRDYSRSYLSTPSYELPKVKVPIRHSSYNALRRHLSNNTLSTTTYGTVSRDSIYSSSNKSPYSIYSLPNKTPNDRPQTLQKSFSNPSIYRDKIEKHLKLFELKKMSKNKSTTDDLTASLTELSAKYDAYINHKEYLESSSDTNTDSTVRYVPDEDTLKSDEPEYIYSQPDKVPTLKKLSLKTILSFKNGIDLLSNIYFVPPQKSTHLNKTTKKCYCPHHTLLTKELTEMHKKFTQRRRYFENQRPESKKELNIVEDIYSPKTPKSGIFNVHENYTKELLEEAANLLALRKYRETRLAISRKYIDRNYDLITYKVDADTPNAKLDNLSNGVNKHEAEQLELIQNEKQFRTNSINQMGNNVQPNETKINIRSYSAKKSHSSVTSAINREPKVNSQPDFRQTMYAEYMKNVAERFERRQKKVIKITKRPDTAPTMVKIFNEVVSKKKPGTLEEEFMQKARTRLHKLGFTEEEIADETGEESSTSSKKDEKLPEHLQEFIQMSGEAVIKEEDSLFTEIDNAVNGFLSQQDNQTSLDGSNCSLFDDIDTKLNGFLSQANGVWSPGQPRKLERRSSDVGDQPKETKIESKSNTPIIWSPRSAPSSPTNERKSYRPVKFESPVLSRKNAKTFWEAEKKQEDSILKRSTSSNTVITTVNKKKNAHSQTSVCDNGYENSEKNQRANDSTKVTSTVTSFTSSNLPRAQNPTITLLQKAREGQLPKGALYLDHIMNEKENRDTNKRVQSNEIVYVQREYESENENKRPKTMAQVSGKKLDGIGPTTKEGIPTVLRSEVRDANHQKWYKQMYESLHKSYDDHDFVTVRYKTRARDRGYVHSGGGYQSEPEQFSGYNSDFDASRYSTYDDRTSKNKENQFTFGTVPRSSANVDVYKNQPGRIEDYEPGHSSIAQKQTKQWWDEVMDIFDNNNVDGNYSTSSQRKTFSTLHGSGYESDSTLVFKRREDNQQQAMSPAEQRSFYKSIQKGGEVPLHGLRKPAPEKPKDDSDIEYFPISPHLTRIRVHKNKIEEEKKKPLTFSSFKRSAKLASIITNPPAPPIRKSSKYSALKFCSKMSFSKPYTIQNKKAVKTNTNASSSQAVTENERKMPPGTIVKSSTTYYTSRKNQKEDKSLKVTVAISTKGKDVLKTSSFSKSAPKSKLNGFKKAEKPQTKSFVSYVDKGEEKKCKKIEAKKSTKKVENPKKKTGNEESVQCYVFNPDQSNQFGEEFFQNLLSSENKKVKKRQPTKIKSEPSLNSLQVYLKHKKPVSESKFRYLEKESQTAGGWELDGNSVWTRNESKFWLGRSSSEPPPIHDKENEFGDRIASPSSRKIRSCRSPLKPIESISGIRIKPKKDLSTNLQKSTSSSSLTQLADHADYQMYVMELMHSTRKSERFKELKNFYSALERKGVLEKTAFNYDLKPRLKGEEVIDYERWKELRKKEKAEEELKVLYQKLKTDQKYKNLLYCPNDADQLKWNRNRERGLKIREKSVEDLRQQFQYYEENQPRSRLELSKEGLYKPLWRGLSVQDVAKAYKNVTSSVRGRPILETKRSLSESTRPIKADKYVGNRIWSSLSMEQLNGLKSQLNEIYSTVSTLKRERIQKMLKNCTKNEITVDNREAGTGLHVRCNSMISKDQMYSPALKKKERPACRKSDSISSIPTLKDEGFSEIDKKKLSKKLSKELMERMKSGNVHKKRKTTGLVIPRETMGAVAAVKSKRRSPNRDANMSPRTCYSLDVSDDDLNGNDKNDFLLVLTPDKNVFNAQPVKPTSDTESLSSNASTVIHLGKVNSQKRKYDQEDVYGKKFRTKSGNLYSSSSVSDFKEIFGEHYRTLSPISNPGTDSQCSHISTKKYRNSNHYGSESSVYSRSRSVSPDPTKYYRAYLKMVKAGDVRKLRNKFESMEDLRTSTVRKYNQHCKRYRSDPELTRLLLQKGFDKTIVRGHEYGDVKYLKDRYERKYGTRKYSRSVSPIPKMPLSYENRLMPHINVISKQADLLQLRSPSPRTNRFFTGEVDKLKRKFEKDHMSIIGQMFTSSPDIRELRNISPYLECEWIAHQYPQPTSPQPISVSPTFRKHYPPRSTSVSPVRRKQSSILKQKPNYDAFANQKFDPNMHTPAYRYEPPSEFYSGSYFSSRPTTVKFKEPVTRTHDSLHTLSSTTGGMNDHRFSDYESPHKYAESEVTLQYKIPVRNEIKEAWSEEELNRRQAETMRRIYQEERRRKYLQELQDMSNRRHTDNLLPSQKSPIPLNRYDDVLEESVRQRWRSRTPEPKLVARALYHFTGQTSRELTFRKGDIIFVRRQIDKNWYEGEHNAMIGLFPINYVEIIPYDEIRTLPKRPSEGQARTKFNFVAQTNLELSLVKGELIILTRRVDDNWYEGRIGNRRGIFPVSYVNVIREPGEYSGLNDSLETSHNNSRKPVASPAAHSLITNQQSVSSQHNYQPNNYTTPITLPRTATRSRDSNTLPLNETLHIDTNSEPIPYRALYNYKPQNEDELELREGDTVYVMEKCDDGWYVGSSQRTSHFGTFPGNYVERIS